MILIVRMTKLDDDYWDNKVMMIEMMIDMMIEMMIDMMMEILIWFLYDIFFYMNAIRWSPLLWTMIVFVKLSHSFSAI